MTQRFTHIGKQILNGALTSHTHCLLFEENFPDNRSTECKFLFISDRRIDEMISENILIDDTRCFHSVDLFNEIPSI